MTVIAIATLSDWLKRLAPVFQPMRSKTKTNRTTYAWLFPRFERVTGNCYELWFVRVVIGRSNCFGFGFSTVTWKPPYFYGGSLSFFNLMPNFRTVHCLPCIVHGQPCTSIFRHHLSPTPSTITRRMKRAMRGVRRWCLWGLELLDFTTYRRTRNRNRHYQTSSISPLTFVMMTRGPIQKDINFIKVSRLNYTVWTSRDANKAILNFWLDDLNVRKNIYAVQPRSQRPLSRPSTVQGCIFSLRTVQAGEWRSYSFLKLLNMGECSKKN